MYTILFSHVLFVVINLYAQVSDTFEKKFFAEWFRLSHVLDVLKLSIMVLLKWLALAV